MLYLLMVVIMLPTVEPSMVPLRVLPLLIFVNVKSGGCQVRQTKSCDDDIDNDNNNFNDNNNCAGVGAHIKFQKASESLSGL